MKLTDSNSNARLSDARPKRVFAWLSRIGAAPKFGDRPISWYQQHQCAAIDYLIASWARDQDLRCKHGVIQGRDTAGLWLPVVSARQLRNIAEERARSSVL